MFTKKYISKILQTLTVFILRLVFMKHSFSHLIFIMILLYCSTMISYVFLNFK